MDFDSTPIPVTFPAGNTNPQTVSVPIIPDFFDEPVETLTMTLVSLNNAAIGSPGEARLEIVDDDQAGFMASPTSLSVIEPAGTVTFTLRLTSQPIATVTLSLTSSDLSECTVAPAAVTFSPANWDQPQVITVTAVSDGMVDGVQSCTVQTAAAVSTDPAYNEQNAGDIDVTVLDIWSIYLPLVRR